MTHQAGQNVLVDTMDSDTTLKYIPLGGVCEIGKNMSALVYGDQILVVDCGLMFPDEEMYGVDIVIPDVTYLVENADKVQGIVLTHGHEDHIGALPYILRQINLPIWGTRLTMGLVRAKLEEHGMVETTDMHEVQPGESIDVGMFNVEFIRVSHSIPDGVGLAIHTPLGLVVYTGDFKFDQTPADGKFADFARLAQLGEEGVLLLMSDCTNVEKPGHTPSERTVATAFEVIFARSKGRIFIATFASNINRIQQVINTAVRFGRKVAIAGRSMARNTEIAQELGYLQIPSDTWIRLEDVKEYFPVEVVVLTTGSQGEPLSALTRMAMDEFPKVQVEPGDTVIISATPIPGNEDLVMRTVNHLFKRGAEVIYDAVTPVHVSGHANRDELKLMLNLTRPKYVVPVHGEYRHVVKYRELAQEMLIPRENIFIMEVGDVLEIAEECASMSEKVVSGDVLVDGIGVGDVGDIVLRDRRHLSQDGIFVIVLSIDKSTGALVAGPDMVSRGFVYMEEAEELIEEAREVVINTLSEITVDASTEWSAVKDDVRRAVAKLLYARTHRRPIVIPVMMEI